MLEFDVSGPQAAACHLLRRADIAALQAGYLEELVETSPAPFAVREGLTGALLEAICFFSPGIYERLLDEHHGHEPAALHEYLATGLGLEIGRSDVYEWSRALAESAAILRGILAEPAEPLSSSENVLLAIPHMDPRPTSTGEIDGVVEGYVRGITGAHTRGDDVLLQALADWGRRWQVIVEVEVPLGQPWTIEMSETRPSGWQQGCAHQVLSLGDAQSSHFEIAVTDPSVSLDANRRRLETLMKDELGPGVVDDIRDTSETLSIYSTASSDKPYYARLILGFRRPAYVRLGQWMIVALTLTATVGAALVGEPQLVEKLAVLGIPTTIAAALLLAREETALAARVDRRARASLAVATAALWGVVVSRLGLL